jgi:phage shock protein PspC (stress-responsive transcriptional regulator)
MKKNFTVNIGGRVFNIDDDAFEHLNSYLIRLQNFFANEKGNDEILADIEMRIAELLDKQKEQGQITVNLKQVKEIIASMGEPDQLSDAGNGKSTPVTALKTRGKLYRDYQRRQIGGVASGIAAWFGIDPVWVRLIFLAFTLLYASGLMIYLILWLILPEAQTTSEKLEMQRRSINIKTISSELSSAGSGIKRTGNSILLGIGATLRFLSEILIRLTAWFLRLLARLTGLFMLLIMLSVFVGLGVSSLIREPVEMGNYHLYTGTLVNALQWLVPGSAVRWLAYISLALILIGITGLMVYGGLRLLLKWPPLRWQIVLIFVLFLVGGIIAGTGTLFQYSGSTKETISITKKQGYLFKQKQIRLISGPKDYFQYLAPMTGDTLHGNTPFVLGRINLNIRPVPADSLFITRIQSATAWQKSIAEPYAQNISYQFSVSDTLITLNPYFLFPQNDGMRYQKLDVIVGVPAGTIITLDPSLRRQINYRDFSSSGDDTDKFVMTASGLEAIQSQVPVSDTTQLLN